MDPVTKLLAFLVVLGVLVVFHELGHYWVARWCGVKVLRFSVGFGRVVWSRRYGPDRTEWAVSAMPLGGYVKMVDEREGAVRRGGPPARVQSAERVEAHRDRRGGADRQPAARGAAVRGNVRRGHSGTARAARRARRARRPPSPACAMAISSSPSTARRCGAGRTCAGGCCAPRARATSRSTSSGPDGARQRRHPAARSLCERRLGRQFHAGARPARGFRRAADRRGRPGQAGCARRAAGGRSHRRDRRRAGALARRGRREDQREARRRSDLPHRPRRCDARCGDHHRDRRTGGTQGRDRRRAAQGRSRRRRAARRDRALRPRRGARAGRAQDLGAVGVHRARCSDAS